MRILVEMVFGAGLYGTDDDESDVDLCSVYVPSGGQIVGQNCPGIYKQGGSTNTRKNTPDDQDHTLFPLHRFLNLALENDSGAMDMLHAPPIAWNDITPEWQWIREHRARFYTRGMAGSLGYARHQANKYGVKGERLQAIQTVLADLVGTDPRLRLRDIWDELPSGPYIQKIPAEQPAGNHREYYEVCGRKFHDTAAVKYCTPILQGVADQYGARAATAASNQGVDWKAMSHALRVARQTCTILRDRDLTFPLPDAELLLAVKRGRIPAAEVAEMIDRALTEAEQLSAASDLRAEPDTTVVPTIIEQIYGTEVMHYFKDIDQWGCNFLIPREAGGLDENVVRGGVAVGPGD